MWAKFAHFHFALITQAYAVFVLLRDQDFINHAHLFSNVSSATPIWLSDPLVILCRVAIIPVVQVPNPEPKVALLLILDVL